jgi:hypothetical protein
MGCLASSNPLDLLYKIYKVLSYEIKDAVILRTLDATGKRSSSKTA